MKNKISLYLIAVIAAGSVRFAAAEANGANDVKLDRAVQVYKKADLLKWNREKTAGGEGELLGDFAFTRHQTDSRDAFKEIGWLTLPKGASIGLHKHNDNEDVYIIVSGKGLFTDGNGKETAVEAGDITIARTGQSHALKNIGDEPLIFLNPVAKLTNMPTK